ncbi:MAG TPA: GlsB/YeaQ/YmgE family stress response membrane protein [Acidimicrobiales bacterium]|nr:GlsB/YeaQ/YmgE family stress response membrane protein [Acidimicrobiales bacterium]
MSESFRNVWVAGPVGISGPHQIVPVVTTEVLMLGLLLTFLVLGAVAGFIARLLVPGRDPMSFGATIVLGIVGSFVGGFLGYALMGRDVNDGALQPSGLLGSILGAVVALLVYNAATHRRTVTR